MNETVTTERARELLDILADLDSKATPEPWKVGYHVKEGLTFDQERNIFPPDTTKTHGFQFGGPVCVVQDNGEGQDAEFIGTLRNEYSAIRDLIAEALESRDRIEKLTGVLECSNATARRRGEHIAELTASLAAWKEVAQETASALALRTKELNDHIDASRAVEAGKATGEKK